MKGELNRTLKCVLSVFIICIIMGPSLSFGEAIRVVGDNNYPPFEFMSDEGAYKGFAVDIMNAVAKEAGLELEQMPMDWEDAIRVLQNKQVDVIQSMSMTEARSVIFDFSDPIMENEHAIFVRKETNFINSLSDLQGVRVAYQTGDVTYDHLKAVSSIEWVAVKNQNEAIKALLQDEVDAAVGNKLTGSYIVQREGIEDSIKIVGEPLESTMTAMAVSKGNTELLRKLNEGLKAIKSNGVYDKIYSKWFGEIISLQSRNKGQLALVLGLVFGVSTLGIILVIWLNQSLQKEVQRQTDEIEQSQALLEKNNRQKDNILESIASGIIVLDNSGNVIQYNSAARKILKERIKIGQKFSDLQATSQVSTLGYQEALQGRTYSDRIAFLRENGESIHIQYSFNPIKGPSGCEGTILMITDFTNEKGLMDLLSQNDKLNSLSRLSAGIAHELKNPLNSINAYVKKLPENWDNEEFKGYFLSVVPDEIKRLNVLLMNLLDYTKPNVSQADYVELDDLFEEVDRLFKQKVVEKRVTLMVDAGGLVCWADFSQLKQVIINLVMNSYEALEERGHINLVATPEKNRVVLKVSDNGQGIPKDCMKKVFEPFYTSKEDGTGIGLAICRQLILENGGTIAVESEEGQGTTVTIKLPKFETEYGEAM